MRRSLWVLLGTAGVTAVAGALAWAVLPGATLAEVYPQEGMVAPGKPVHLNVVVTGRPWYDFRPVTVTVTDGLAAAPVATLTTKGGTVAWTPPVAAAGGYGVTATLGKRQASSAIDVGASWAERPRYGFLSDFAPTDKGQAERFETMARFHINGLQFYDWMYRHSDYMPPTDTFKDPLNRLLALSTVQEKIALGHRYGMNAMAYVAIYGAPKAFYEAHKEWALYDIAGRPFSFGDGFLYIMNPEAGGPWAAHMVSEYGKIVRDLPFDGIHLDQYGDPKFGFRYPGGDGATGVDLTKAIVSLIDATRATVGPGKSVLFNDVGGWPLADTAPTSNDAVYVEVWPPNITFENLRELIEKGRALSGGKPVVLAAYIPPEYEPSVTLTDAVIFAAGGSHLEIGEGSSMLADPYFPKYRQMSPALSERLRRYYDVAVRYDDLLYAKDLKDWESEITVEGSRVLPGGYFNGVWPYARENGRYGVISFINLNGLDDARWAAPRTAAPPVLEQRQVTVAMAQAPKAAYLISPDGPDQSPRPLNVTYQDGKATFTLDRLAYWTMVVFEK
jgi:dextranase